MRFFKAWEVTVVYFIFMFDSFFSHEKIVIILMEFGNSNHLQLTA